ncbi:MAG: RodZ domain-containing protein [Arenicellales bacterium]
MSEEIIEPQKQNYGPGSVLRAKREEYEWSVEAVAEALHLATDSVRSIEADRYDELPGATYVLGYWRSYARLLGIDMESTIEANKKNLQIVTPASTGVDVSNAYHYKSKKGGVLLVFLLLASLAAFGYYAWQQNFFDLLLSDDSGAQSSLSAEGEDADAGAGNHQILTGTEKAQVLRPLELSKPKLKTVVNEPVAKLAPADVGNADVDKRKASGLVLSNVAPNTTITNSTAQQGLNMASNQGLSSEANKVNTPLKLKTIANSVPPIAKTEPILLTEGAKVKASAEAPSTASSQTNGDVTKLVLSLTKDSWLDVRDKSNKRIIYETKTAGSVVTVKGNPPFYVYIGTPSGVKVQYKGKDVPFKTHDSGLFARFKLGDVLQAL